MKERTPRTYTIYAKEIVFLLVEYLPCGHRGRYTIYQLPQFGLQTPKIIGRELPLKFARKLIQHRIQKSNIEPLQEK